MDKFIEMSEVVALSHLQGQASSSFDFFHAHSGCTAARKLCFFAELVWTMVSNKTKALFEKRHVFLGHSEHSNFMSPDGSLETCHPGKEACRCHPNQAMHRQQA